MLSKFKYEFVVRSLLIASSICLFLQVLGNAIKLLSSFHGL